MALSPGGKAALTLWVDIADPWGPEAQPVMEQIAALVGGRGLAGAHFVQHDRNAGLGGLPGGFRSGQAAADDVDRVKGHARVSTLPEPLGVVAKP